MDGGDAYIYANSGKDIWTLINIIKKMQADKFINHKQVEFVNSMQENPEIKN
mgnify:CR=1 FL=1